VRPGIARYVAGMQTLTRRRFGCLAAVAAACPWTTAARSRPDDALQSEVLLDLAIEAQAPQPLGNGRVIVPVSGGTFEGPPLRGRIVPPAGDWIVERPDGSRILDVRLLLRTDDGQAIYASWRGIADSLPGGALVARILPVFETGAASYAWLNKVVAVGVYRPTPGKIGYRVYRIL
jgi:hypothetical protein